MKPRPSPAKRAEVLQRGRRQGCPGSVGLGGRINMIMQTAFFKLANVLAHFEKAVEPAQRTPSRRTYGKQGRQDRQHELLPLWTRAWTTLEEVEIPGTSWATATEGRRSAATATKLPAYISAVVRPILAQQGDKLPVSAMDPDWSLCPLATAAVRKARRAPSTCPNGSG